MVVKRENAEGSVRGRSIFYRPFAYHICMQNISNYFYFWVNICYNMHKYAINMVSCGIDMEGFAGQTEWGIL